MVENMLIFHRISTVRKIKKKVKKVNIIWKPLKTGISFWGNLCSTEKGRSTIEYQIVKANLPKIAEIGE